MIIDNTITLINVLKFKLTRNRKDNDFKSRAFYILSRGNIIHIISIPKPFLNPPQYEKLCINTCSKNELLF